MSTPKKIKIRLTPGISQKHWESLLQNLEGAEILFSLPSDLPILAESNFLKRLKTLAKKHKTTLRFFTRKKYYQELLEKQGWPVRDKIPKAFSDLPLTPWKELCSVVEASKNAKPSKTEVAFTPKIGKSVPKFSATKIRSEEGADKRPVRGLFFFLILLILAGIGGIFLWISPHVLFTVKGQISVVPITHNVVLTLPQAEIPEVEENLPTINAIYTQAEVAGKETFSTLDRKYEVTNAKGELTIFNTTSKEKFFIPSRLSTPEGYIFRFKKDITVPPATEEGPGRIIVEVEADPFKEDGSPIGGFGNIVAGTDLFFPALRKETRELYYAKANRGPLVGGSTLTRYFMGEEDIEKSKPFLSETFQIRAKESLIQELAKRSSREKTEYILLDYPDLLQSEILSFEAPEDQVGQEQKTFEMSGRLRLQGIVFDRDEVLEILREKISKTQDHRKKLLRLDETSFEYRVLDFSGVQEQRWLKLSVSVQGIETLDFQANNVFAREWRKELKKEIAGQSLQKAQNILTNHPEIEGVRDVSIRPFWADKVPDLYDQIELRVVVEE